MLACRERLPDGPSRAREVNMTTLRSLDYAVIGTALIAGVLAIACRLLANWLLRDLRAKRAARSAQHKSNGRD